MSTNKEIQIGDVFGKLTIIKKIDKPKNAKVRGQYYECLCECGEKTIAYTSQLNSGHKKSCGHCARNKKIGQKYGKLLVLSIDKIIDGKVYFKCRCDCGNIVSVSSNNLISGNSTSCGTCNMHSLQIGQTYNHIKVLKDLGKNKIQHFYQCKCLCCDKIFETNKVADILNNRIKSCGCLATNSISKIKIGDKFNRLTIISKTEKRSKSRGIIWKCKCDCGKEIEVSSNSLLMKNTQSCGCLQREISAEMGKQNIHYVNSHAFMLNEYDLSGEYGIGFSIDKQHYFLFDKEDYDKIKNYLWSIKEDGIYSYWSTKTSERTIRLHRFILDCTDSQKVVDHINHKVYDNRKENLRICEHYQNSINSKMYSNNTSGCKGVYWNKEKEKWDARITANKQVYWLGRFENFEDAVKVRKEAEKKYHKEFTYKEKEEII